MNWKDGDKVRRKYTGDECTVLHQMDWPKCVNKFYRVQMAYENRAVIVPAYMLVAIGEPVNFEPGTQTTMF